MHDQASAIAAPRGDLALAVCEACGFIFNRAFDPARPMYGEEYENTQGCSPSFNQHMNDLVREMVVNRNVRDSHVVEVGCGNGLFLRKLVSYEGAGNRGSGFDPSYRGNESEFDGRLRFSTRYYDFESAEVPADVAAEFYTSAALGLLVWWIDHDFCHGPEWLADVYRRLATPTMAW